MTKVSIPYRYGTTPTMEQVAVYTNPVSIPYRYGTTLILIHTTSSSNYVSIPYRYGTTTVFKPFLTAILYKSSKITRFSP